MRITRRPTTTIPGVGELPGPSEGTDTASTGGGGPVTDRVQLSEAARLRQRLKTEVGDTSVTDGERVATLQNDLANQTYAPSPHAVAAHLLGELTANLLA